MFVDFFIKRPVFATVCAILITLVGAVSIPTLPIAQYPSLGLPQVSVSSFYTGASAEVVESAVTTPLELQINGVPGMKSIESTSSSDGSSQISVTFDVDRDIDLAAVDVQNRVGTASGGLPNEVKQAGISISKNSGSFVLAAALSTDDGRYDQQFISNYADVYMRDALKRVAGVSSVQIFGERRFSMRIWLDPVRLAARQLTAGDVVTALQEQNVQVAAGSVGLQPAPAGQAYQFSVRAMGRLVEASEFEEVIVRASPGSGGGSAAVRLRDVGRAELGAESYNDFLRYNGKLAAGLGITQLPGANALDVAERVKAELARLSRGFPPGLRYEVAFDTTLAVSQSIREVLVTLAEAIALVIAVIFVFLQSFRVTVIPAITIPVSLVGTFAFVKLFGFSINTLFATLQVFMGSQYVNDFDYGGRTYRVYVQADQPYRANPRDLTQLYVRTGSGAMVPLESVIKVVPTTTAQVISHYNLFRSTEISGSPAEGVSSGEALLAMEEVARKTLPQGMSFEWSGISKEQIESGGKAVTIFALGLLFVFLVLAAQYESFALPFVVILAVPLAVLGALGAQLVRGYANDVFCQIGLVMLIGLASKNAILIVEFAHQLRDRGTPVVAAAIEAAETRLRPILMTSLAFLLGVLPLLVATGAGSGSRRSLGTAVFGGMLVSTVMNLFFIPVVYVLLEMARERLRGKAGVEDGGEARVEARVDDGEKATVAGE